MMEGVVDSRCSGFAICKMCQGVVECKSSALKCLFQLMSDNVYYVNFNVSAYFSGARPLLLHAWGPCITLGPSNPIFIEHLPQGWHEVHVLMRQCTEKGPQDIDLSMKAQVFVNDKALLVFHDTKT